MTFEQPPFVIAAAVNNNQVLEKNLFASPLFAELKISLEVRHGYECASRALNSVIDMTDKGQIVICAHQDVYFPDGWEKSLLTGIEYLDALNEPWAVLGVFGVTVDKLRCGKAWSVGLGREVVGDRPAPAEAVSLDEIVIIVKGGSGVRFDDNLPGFHLYGTDIVQNAYRLGYKAFIIEAPVIHNSIAVRHLGIDYWRSYLYCRKKWKDNLPIPTSVVTLTRYAGPLIKHNLSSFRRFLLKKLYITNRANNPKTIAEEIGYNKRK